MPEGLWASGGKLQRDLATITQRIRLLGFNADLLPVYSLASHNLHTCAQAV